MAATKISNLTSTSVVSNTDILVVVRDPSGTPSTNNITTFNLANSIVSMLPSANTTAAGTIKLGRNLSANATKFVNVSVTGPYANDSLAAAGSVPLSGLYYDSTGTVKIRLV